MSQNGGLGELLSLEELGEGIVATVGFVDFLDLNSVVSIHFVRTFWSAEKDSNCGENTLTENSFKFSAPSVMAGFLLLNQMGDEAGRINPSSERGDSQLEPRW